MKRTAKRIERNRTGIGTYHDTRRNDRSINASKYRSESKRTKQALRTIRGNAEAFDLE